MTNTKFIDSFTHLSILDRKKIKNRFEKEVKSQVRIILKTGIFCDEDYLSINHSKAILFIVAFTLRINVESIRSKSRMRPLADARKIYAYIVKNVSTVTIVLSDAGSLINCTHAAIISRSREAEFLMRSNKEFVTKLNQCITAYKERKNEKPE